MIVTINKKLNFKNNEPIEIYKSLSLENKINKKWNKFIKGKEGYFNGDIFVVTNLVENDKEYTFKLGKAKYADLIYAKENIDLSISSLFTSIALKTKDNYYVFILNNHGRVNTIGGLASEEDFIDGVFYPEICLEREIKEEIGLNINNKNDFVRYDRKYLKISKEENSPCGVIFTGVLNYTKKEFERYFNSQKENLDNEIQKLLFYTKDNYLKLNNIQNKENYLIELIETIEKNVVT